MVGLVLVGALQVMVTAGEDHSIPAGFVYPEPTITPEKARELATKHAVLTLLKLVQHTFCKSPVRVRPSRA
jgi:hypothetical protein